MSLDEKLLRVYADGAPEMLLLHIGEASDALADKIRGMTGRNHALAMVPVTDWNRDLSPWPGPPVFGREGFAGQARETLDALLSLLPRLNPDSLPVCLGGYSLAGLFALWSQYVCPAFDAVMSASPSVWFPGWDAFADSRVPQGRRAYMSLGLQEPHTRNRTLSTVGDALRRQHARFQAAGIPARLDWNAGNHFTDPEGRCAKGYALIINGR